METRDHVQTSLFPDGDRERGSLDPALELLRLNAYLQIRFARSATEFCEQTAAFGAEVGPLLAG